MLTAAVRLQEDREGGRNGRRIVMVLLMENWIVTQESLAGVLVLLFVVICLPVYPKKYEYEYSTEV